MTNFDLTPPTEYIIGGVIVAGILLVFSFLLVSKIINFIENYRRPDVQTRLLRLVIMLAMVEGYLYSTPERSFWLTLALRIIALALWFRTLSRLARFMREYNGDGLKKAFRLVPTVALLGGVYYLYDRGLYQVLMVAAAVVFALAIFRGLTALFSKSGMDKREAQNAAALTIGIGVLGVLAAAAEANKKSAENQRQQAEARARQLAQQSKPVQPSQSSSPSTRAAAPKPQRAVIQCKKCNGSGFIDSPRCSSCDGTGRVADPAMGMAGEHYTKKCGACNGSGRGSRQQCSSCGGRGTL